MSEELTFDYFMTQFQLVAENRLPLDFYYDHEEKYFDITLVVLWRIEDAFVLHPKLRSFVKVSVETQEQYEAMLAFLKNGRDEVVKYLDKCLAQCEEKGF